MNIWSLLLVAGLSTVPAESSVSLLGERAPEGALFERVVVIGASLSSGFGLDREVGAPLSFAKIFDEVLVAEHGAILSNVQPWFFADPEGYGRLMIDDIVKRDPTLVVAVDFPFWFGYGSLEEEKRVPRLELALSLLEELKCPVVVGNFPNMDAALGSMLSVIQIPEPPTLTALNDRIRAWTDQKPTRMLADLAAYSELIREEQDVQVGSGWEGKRAKELLQEDQLHPSLIGAVMIAIMTGEVLSKDVKEVEANSFDSDIGAVVERVRALHGAPQTPLKQD